MQNNKGTVRYVGYRVLPDGGRGFDFSFEAAGADVKSITIEAPMSLFIGTDRLPIQEGAGVCYETLRWRVENDAGSLPSRLTLTSADVVQHRKITKPHGRRR